MEELNIGTRIDHDKYGEGLVSKVNITNYEIFFARHGKMEISKSNVDYRIIEHADNPGTKPGLNLNEIEEMLSFVLDRYGILPELVKMGEKWENGSLILQPGNPELKPKEIPIGNFFHKIVMVRDRLRVLEQNINSHKTLSDQEKVDLQQYITRIYGSLTTFNILFAERDDYFKGSGK